MSDVSAFVLLCACIAVGVVLSAVIPGILYNHRRRLCHFCQHPQAAHDCERCYWCYDDGTLHDKARYRHKFATLDVIAAATEDKRER